MDDWITDINEIEKNMAFEPNDLEVDHVMNRAELNIIKNTYTTKPLPLRYRFEYTWYSCWDWWGILWKDFTEFVDKCIL
jgi:hypothetical protein